MVIGGFLGRLVRVEFAILLPVTNNALAVVVSPFRRWSRNLTTTCLADEVPDLGVEPPGNDPHKYTSYHLVVYLESFG